MKQGSPSLMEQLSTQVEVTGCKNDQKCVKSTLGTLFSALCHDYSLTSEVFMDKMSGINCQSAGQSDGVEVSIAKQTHNSISYGLMPFIHLLTYLFLYNTSCIDLYKMKCPRSLCTDDYFGSE